MAGNYTDVGLCWAKLHRRCEEGRGAACRATCSCDIAGVLSLIGHSADVAAVLLGLLERPVIGQRLARLLGRPELTAEDRERLAALAALHDIGKISQGFQRAPFAAPRRATGHVKPLLSLVLNEHCDGQVKKQWRRLEDIGGLGKLSALLGREDGWLPFKTALAHHGSLPQADAADPLLWRPASDHDPAVASRALVDTLAAWCPAAFDGVAPDWNSRFGHAFAGLLMLADWLASDEAEFPMSGEMGAPDGAARFAWSRPRARDLLARRLLSPEQARRACAALHWDAASLTGFPTASAAQAAMLALPPAPPEGRICLIEDETGSGKTEAALIHFLRLFAEGAVDGMYFALPTRAAAVQIHGRIARQLRCLLGAAAPPVILAVPGYLDHGSEEAAGLPDEAKLWPDEASDAGWSSARPKRYLAACIAVGTIDQALMGGLKLRHAQLRSSALLRLLLVADEVHATDIYMTALLRNLLDQHRAAGGHALLMSATLGATARRWLLKPHMKPRSVALLESVELAIATPYPAIWTDHDGRIAPPPEEPPERAPKAVAVVLEQNWQDPLPAVQRAVEAARRGARVLLIRNTVRDVVATQMVLEEVAPDLSLAVDGVRAPHHARFAPEDRRRLDAALEAAIGANTARRGGSVTITSQTAEQSLDIDADLLITDLCPADVLLQRIGRLHRKRDRSPVAGFETACVIVLAPAEDELAACIDAKGEVSNPPLALGLVYADLLGVVATRRKLTEAGTLSIPRDNRPLVESATHPDLLKSLADGLGGHWPAHWAQRSGGKAAHEQEARHACLDWDKDIEPLPDLGERIKVRLGLDDRLIDVPDGTIGPFGQPISRLTIPGRWLGGLSSEAERRIVEAADGQMVIGFAEKRFIYDRLGLRRA